MPTLVHALAAAAPGAPLAPTSIERRDPGPHDVVIDIAYTGVCHSDIHQARDEWGGAIFPMVPGHEITGTVAGVGDEVTRYSVGDRVGVGVFVDSCRACSSCKAGEEQYCRRGEVATYNARDYDGRPTMGGYSTRIVVDESYVLAIPVELAMDAAAPLLCAGITVYSPLRHWGVGPDKRVAVVGLGGLGHLAVQFAHALGAETTVLSHSLAKQDDGLRFGADHYYATSDSKVFNLLEGSLDLVLNTVSANLDLDQYLSTLCLDGTMVNVGLPAAADQFSAFSLANGRRSLAGSKIGGIRETQEMLDFCAQHTIAAEIELINADQVNAAYERVLSSDVRYRFVIDVASLTDVVPA